MNWPIVEGDFKVYNENKSLAVLFIGNEDWRRDYFHKNISISGKLITPQGIERIVLNVISNPHIREIVVIGDEVKPFYPLDALRSLYDNSMNDNSEIKDTVANVKTLNKVNREHVEVFREQIVNIEFFRDENELREYIETHDGYETFETDFVLDLDSSEGEECDVANSKMNHKIVAYSIDQAWIKSLETILNMGKMITSSNFRFKEVLNLFVEIRNPTTIDIDLVNTSLRNLEKYSSDLIDPDVEKESEYTYGKRLRYFGKNNIDQIGHIVNRLKDESNSRRATASLWLPQVDAPKGSGQPCLTSVDFKLRDGKVNLTAVFRSNDIYKASPTNWYGLGKLLEYVADKLSKDLGKLSILAQSAHIYATDFNDVKNDLDDIVGIGQDYIEDDFGYFVIEIIDDEINVSFHDLDGAVKNEFSGSNAKKLRREILNSSLISLKEHACYLGEELQKAEMALKYDIDFKQSKA